ncbi:Toxin FitB [Dolichospermum sp. UHCC 0315A]|nr:Toxin FitB [Dolichospermum sp. UHCC 0315A]
MIILDTNVISELMKTQKSAIVREWVAAQPLMSLFTTTITQAEILYGIALLPEGKLLRDKTGVARQNLQTLIKDENVFLTRFTRL